MNSYPLEFLAHPQPLMFVAGLSRPRAASTSTAGRRSISGPGKSPSPDPNTSSSSATSASMAGASFSPPGGSSNLPPLSPNLDSGPVPAGIPILSERDAEFETLQSELRSVFARFGGPGRVWVPEAERSNFRVVLVDKNVRLPLRKMHPSAPGEETHSPLSPLTPSSPLYPDGIIAPVWIRKHADLVPSVFVLFLRLFETPPRGPAESPLGDEVLASAEKEREREADEALIKEIAERRQRLQDRGIKLTVVLMASAATLDAPNLDQRLSHLRRSSQLSAKASLFVLTPVPSSELPDFVRSLHDALYESAMEYYSAHGKRVRRKRGRVGSSNNNKEKDGRGRSGSVSVQSKPLGPQGWAVRYDFKAGWFAEVRGELDLARRHYEDCWNELAKMFSSTTVLPPRTKRWAEAKVLADCVASRICKLLLYENEPSRVLVPYYVHLRRFGDLSHGWGIGEETFEFWSWVARQFRLLGEIVEMAEDNGFVIPPLPLPTYPPPPMTPNLDALLPDSAVNALHLLHPPAFYYYTAACCTVERKARLEAALEAEQRGGTTLTAAPGFANEKKVDHSALIVELLTKTFNLLKDSGQEHNGLALYAAFRTAQVHAEAGQHELALRFLDRLADKFQADDWRPVLRQLRSIEYKCSQATGNVDTAARLLIEMLAPNSGVEGEERAALQDDLLNLLKTTVPSTSDPIILDLGDDAVFDVRAGFRAAEVPSGSSIPFQVSIAAPAGVDISRIQFSSMRVGFSDDRPNLTISSGGDDRVVNVGTVTPDSVFSDSKAPLKWISPEPLVITGEVVAESGPVEISDVVVCLTHGSWNIELRLVPNLLHLWTAGGKTFAPLKGIYQALQFIPRPHEIKLDVSHGQLAFVGEAALVKIRVTSTDERDLDLKLNVSLQDDDERGITSITYDGKTSTFVEGAPLTLMDGVAEALLHVTAAESGTTVLAISIESSVPGTTDTSETTHMALLPVLAPFDCVPTINRTGQNATISAVLRIPARTVEISAFDIEPEAEGVTLVSSSIQSVQFPQVWDETTAFALAARFKIQSAAQRLAAPPGSAAVLRIRWRPVDVDGSDEITTMIALPPLAPVSPEAFVTASLDSAAVVRANQPFTLRLSVSNAHPTEQAYVVVQGDTADGFVWTGPRGMRIGPIPAGGSTTVPIQVVPVGGAGWQALPRISVLHGEGSDKREVRISVPGDRPIGTVLVQP